MRQESSDFYLRFRLGIRLLIFAGSLTSACSGSSATTAAASPFEGRTIQIVVGTTAGGTHDLYARVMAQYFGRHVPGRPTVVVQNMAGAGGLLALKYLAQQAKPDGLTIGLVTVPGIMAQVTGYRETKEDTESIRALGSPSNDVPLCLTSPASGIDLAGWKAEGLRPRFGVTGDGTPIHMNTMLITTALHLPVQAVIGYKGTVEIRQAMASRELDGTCVGVDSYLSSFEPKEDYRVILQLGGTESDLEAVPALSTLVAEGPDEDLVRFAQLIGRISRFYAVPAGTPDQLVASLRRAFDETMRDPDFLQAAKLARLPIDPRSGSQTEQSVAELLNMPSALRERIAAIVKPDGS